MTEKRTGKGLSESKNTPNRNLHKNHNNVGKFVQHDKSGNKFEDRVRTGFKQPGNASSDGTRHPFEKHDRTGFKQPAGASSKGGNTKFSKPAFRSQESAPAAKRISIADTPRFVALLTLEDVLFKDSYASAALDARLQSVNMIQADKRLTGRLVYTTLENMLFIDRILDMFLKEKDNLPSAITNDLRLGVAQIFFHDRIPENAIVDEAVKIAHFLKLEKLCALVNATLREILRKKESIAYPDEEKAPFEYLSFMYSMPEWICKRLCDAYGYETAKAICAFRKDRHYITLRKNGLLYPSDDLFEKNVLGKKVWEKEKSILPGVWRVYGISELARDNDYLSGNFSVQGESSIVCARAMNVKPGMKVLDCCAAPGGKTACMAEMMQGTGRIYAWDMHEHRVALIHAMKNRLHLENVRPALHDAAILKEDLVDSMDAVLLDAPCSGLGVMDDKPDIKLRISEESVAELCGIQEKLLDVCSSYVRKGGTFVYSTCSVLSQENSEQIRHFLEKHQDFVIASLPESIPEKYRQHCTPLGLQLLPFRDDTEGFFIAVMKRER